MSQATLTPTDPAELEQLPAIQKDEIAEEVCAARLYAKRLTRTVVAGQSVLLVLFGLCAECRTKEVRVRTVFRR